jgi:hypothetical protein
MRKGVKSNVDIHEDESKDNKDNKKDGSNIVN